MGGQLYGGICPGGLFKGNYLGDNCHRRNFIGCNCPRGGGDSSRIIVPVAKVQGLIALGENAIGAVV